MTHIEQRIGTAAGWASDNPILHAGEVGREMHSTGAKTKTGDGINPWNDLPYDIGVLPDSVALTGNPTAPTPATGDDDTSIATTEWVKNQQYASLASPVFSGNPTAPTPTLADDDTSVATTGFVKDVIETSPALGGTPTAPNPAADDDDTSIATTAWVRDLMLAMHPVGDILTNVSGTNPGTYLGGTWAAFGSGRVPVGRDAAQTEFDTAEETGGSKTNNLAHTHTMAHTHGMAHSHPLNISNNASLGGVASRTNSEFTQATTKTDTDGSSNPNTGSGGSATMNNLQPYIVVYMWKRTA